MPRISLDLIDRAGGIDRSAHLVVFDERVRYTCTSRDPLMITVQHLHVASAGCEHCQHSLVDLNFRDKLAAAPADAIPARAFGRRHA